MKKIITILGICLITYANANVVSDKNELERKYSGAKFNTCSQLWNYAEDMVNYQLKYLNTKTIQNEIRNNLYAGYSYVTHTTEMDLAIRVKSQRLGCRITKHRKRIIYKWNKLVNKATKIYLKK